MNLHNQVPVFILNVLKADVPQNTGVVDEDVDATEVLDSRLDNFVAILDRVVVRNSLAAGSLDLVDNNVGSLYPP